MAGFGIQKRGTSKILVARKKFEGGGLSTEENKKEPTTYEKKQQLIKERKEKTKQMLEKKGYDTGKVLYTKEKDVESPKMQNILKKYRENIADPTGKFLGKIMNLDGDYDIGSDKARKEILGYKKGGKIKKGKMMKGKR